MARANSITAFDAKNRLGSLLDRVQGGEELIITRHGQPVAKLVPLNKHTDDEVSQAFETFRRIRESMTRSGTKISRDEIKKWRAEGRR
jgi:prevent-host-death family protein